MLPDNNKLELTITIEVRQPNYGHGQIRLEERFQLESRSFIEVCEILGRFKALSDKIHQEGGMGKC